MLFQFLLGTFLLGLLFIVYEWATYFFVRVPYLGTSRKRGKIIFEHLPLEGKIVYDLGCGKGDFLFQAEKYKTKKLVGVELWPVHYWFALFKKWIFRSKVEFRRENYFQTDISEADILYLFLTPPAVQKLVPKILQEAKPKTTIISLGSSVPGLQNEKIIPCEESGRVRLYVYET